MAARKRSIGGTILILLVAGAFYLARENGLLPAGGGPSDGTTATARPGDATSTAAPDRTPAPSRSSSTPAVTRSVGTDDAAKVLDAFRAERSGVFVELAGVVTKSLPDDDDGSRHQRFIVRLANDHTVLVAHNIDLAARVPLDEGDRVRLAGDYEWNDRGGVIHWTHHDPKGWREGGWIEHDGRRYE